MTKKIVNADREDRIARLERQRETMPERDSAALSVTGTPTAGRPRTLPPGRPGGGPRRRTLGPARKGMADPAARGNAGARSTARWRDPARTGRDRARDLIGQPDEMIGGQSSQKTGMRSSGQKLAAARHGFGAMPAARAVPGASGRQRGKFVSTESGPERRLGARTDR
jgi:hypothetical protein